MNETKENVEREREKRRKGRKGERLKKRYRWTESLKDRNDRTEVEIDRGRE